MNPFSFPSIHRAVSPLRSLLRPLAGLVVTVSAFSGVAFGQAPPVVSMMPSYSQNPTYGNAAINVPIQIWGKVSGGSGSYGNFTIDFGDGTAPYSGTVNNADTTFGVGSRDFLVASHTFTSGGSKTVKITVTDSANNTSSRSAVVRVLVAPTHDENINMAIEKGLIFLYRSQVRYGTPLRSYWYQNNAQYGNGTSGASVMSFAENGHLANNDPVADIYAETVKRGIYHIVSLGRQQAIVAQTDGNPDTNGNARGINFSPNYVVYDHGFMLMGVINAFADGASALATPIPAGLWAGGGSQPATFHDFVVDALDCLYWCQADSGLKGWYYSTNTASQGRDGSTHQWPAIAILNAKERWGVTPPSWVVRNSNDTFVGLQYLSAGNEIDGGIGYSNNQSWRNMAKTGGALVGWYLGDKLVGSDDNANRALAFIGRSWYSQAVTYTGPDKGCWDGEFYAMFGLKKGLQLQGVTTVRSPDGVDHDWYKEMSGWLLGNATVLDSSIPPAPPAPAEPASVNSIKFEILNTCDNSTYTFNLNGATITPGIAGNPSGSCTCAPPVVTYTVTDPAMLANWVAGGPNTLSFTNTASNYVAWVRAVITSGGTSTTAYLFDQAGGTLGSTDLCAAGYGAANGGSNNSLFTPATAGPSKVGVGRRLITRAFGQKSDGSWTTTEPPIDANHGGAPISTAHAILVLTKSVTIPLPVAVAAAVPDQSSRFPAPLNLDGSDSYHQSASSNIVEYLWDFDASDGIDWNNPDAAGRITTANPGWNTPGNRTITLRVKDDATTPNYATTTTIVRVVDTDVAPVAVPIPASQLPAVYTGKIGDTIALDGSESFDPEGDPITGYAWDLDGNGTFGDAADAAKDTSGNGARGVTASIIFTAEYNGQIGLRVTSTPPNGNPKSSNNTTTIDVQAATSDLFVASIVSSNVVVGASADIQVVLASNGASGKDAENVVVRFYDGNPLTTGNVIGSSATITIPKGGSQVVNVTGLALTPGQQLVWVYVDSTRIFPEFNESNNTANVNVANKPPVAVAKNITVSAGADCSAAASINDGSSDPDAGDSITLTQVPAGPYPIGTTEVTLTVTDSRGATRSATAQVTVIDDTRPVISGCPVDIIVQTGADRTTCDQVAGWTPPTATDCSAVTIQSTHSPGAIFPVGTTPVTYTATDAFDNTATCSFTVTVEDNTPPAIPVLADVTGQCSATIAGNPTTTDSCAGLIEGTTSDDLTRTTQGSSVVTWSFDDGHGNVVTATQNIIVRDSDGPVIPVLADVTGQCSATIAETPTTTDSCAGPIEGTTSDDLTRTIQGSSVVTWSFDDGHGNVVTAAQNIIVRDTKGPMTPVLADVTGQCSATITQTPTTTDSCAGSIEGTTSDDLTRTTQGSSVVTWSFDDGHGNVVTTTQNIIVKDTEAPAIPVLADVTGECSATIAAAPTTTDNCAGMITGTTSDSLTRTTEGTSVVTWSFDDGHGNVVTATQNIIIVDTLAPVIACPPATSVAFGAVPTAATTSALFIAQGGAIADNCDTDPSVKSVDAVVGLCPTVITRTYTVTDAVGNASTCVQTITVNNLFGGDGVLWHQPIARNGASDDTDPSAGGTLKYRFKLGSSIPIQIHANGCSSDVTANSNVTGKVVVFGDTDLDGVIDAGELALNIAFNGVGGAGGAMDKIGGFLKYNLNTKVLPVTLKCYILQVTVTDTSTGESRVETVPLQVK